MPTATCIVCGVELDHTRHRFTSDAPTAGATKITQQYCDEHCPRCGPLEFPHR